MYQSDRNFSFEALPTTRWYEPNFTPIPFENNIFNNIDFSDNEIIKNLDENGNNYHKPKLTFDNCQFINCDFSWLTLYSGKFVNCYFKNCKFTKTYACGANFLGSVFHECTEFNDANFFNCVNQDLIYDTQTKNALKLNSSNFSLFKFFEKARVSENINSTDVNEQSKISENGNLLLQELSSLKTLLLKREPESQLEKQALNNSRHADMVVEHASKQAVIFSRILMAVLFCDFILIGSYLFYMFNYHKEVIEIPSNLLIFCGGLLFSSMTITVLLVIHLGKLRWSMAVLQDSGQRYAQFDKYIDIAYDWYKKHHDDFKSKVPVDILKMIISKGYTKYNRQELDDVQMTVSKRGVSFGGKTKNSHRRS